MRVRWTHRLAALVGGLLVALALVEIELRIAAPARAARFFRPHEIFGWFHIRLRQEGIEYLDLVPAFRAHAAATGQRLHFSVDFHMNADGHRVTGEALHRFLTRPGPL